MAQDKTNKSYQYHQAQRKGQHFAIILLKIFEICTGVTSLILKEKTFIKKKRNNSIGKDMEKRELSHTVGGNVNWCSHYGKEDGGSSKN